MVLAEENGNGCGWAHGITGGKRRVNGVGYIADEWIRRLIPLRVPVFFFVLVYTYTLYVRVTIDFFPVEPEKKLQEPSNKAGTRGLSKKNGGGGWIVVKIFGMRE